LSPFARKTFKNRLTGIVCLWLSLNGVSLSALGAKEETEPVIQNPLWTLMVTNFDSSSLSSSQAALVETTMRRLVENIGKVNYRERVSREYTYYQTLARNRDLSAAALTLSNKRNERDQLLYAGNPGWRYRRDVKAMDKEIEKLEEAYRQVLAAQTVVEQEPAFTLARQNLEGLFPPAPKEGEEHKFCKAQNSDAFITGTISEYHGRIFITQKLYVLYLNSYVYEDNIMFSPENSESSLAEFAAGISSAIAGVPLAELKITPRPANALVLLNRRYAGRGELSIPDQPPGTFTLEVFADEYESASTELELKGGESLEVEVDLHPLDYAPVTITAMGEEGSSVYHGSLYMGETPLSLDLPRGRLEYVTVESPDGQEAEAVFMTPSPDVLPPAIRTPRRPEFLVRILPPSLFPPKSRLEGNELSLRMTAPYDPEEKRVDKTRRLYYWAWGGTWVSAIAAWMINGYANSIVNSYIASPNPTKEMYDTAINYQKLNYAGIGLVSAAVLLEIIQMGRYIYTAGKDAPVYVD
jgi:hypothetical protein